MRREPEQPFASARPCSTLWPATSINSYYDWNNRFFAPQRASARRSFAGTILVMATFVNARAIAGQIVGLPNTPESAQPSSLVLAARPLLIALLVVRLIRLGLVRPASVLIGAVIARQRMLEFQGFAVGDPRRAGRASTRRRRTAGPIAAGTPAG